MCDRAWQEEVGVTRPVRAGTHERDNRQAPWMVEASHHPVNQERRMNEDYARTTLPTTGACRRDVAADQELAWAIAEAEERGAWAEAARVRGERFARRVRRD